MKQTPFLLALLLLVLAMAATSAGATQLEGAHETQPQEGQAMDECRAYLMKQCTASKMPVTWPWKWRMGSCRALKQRCCNQLEEVPPTCRCKAIRSTVQEMQQQGGGGHQMTMTKVMQMAKTLTSICNMYPSYCHIPTTNQACYCSSY